MGFPGGSDSKESGCYVGELGSISGLGRSPGGGHGNPLQYSCLENPHGQRSLADYSPWVHWFKLWDNELSTLSSFTQWGPAYVELFCHSLNWWPPYFGIFHELYVINMLTTMYYLYSIFTPKFYRVFSWAKN